MNYYDDIAKQIEDLLNNKEYEKAKSIIENELNMPYVPKDFENKLLDYLSLVKSATNTLKTLSDEDVYKYLYDSYENQLIGIDALCKKNLRDYIDVCFEYLKSNGFVNAKALLIDSLIRQEINYDFEYANNGSFIKFNPKNLKIVEETEDFKYVIDVLQEYYMKEPSKIELGKQLLFKEALLTLPNTISGDIVSKKIIEYIDDAFSAK